MKKILLTAVGALGVASMTACWGDVGVDYAGDGYPPDAYIATATPVYYDGHASYFYGGQWYYRDGGGWAHYRGTPVGLRGRYVAPRAYYGNAHGGGYRGAVRGGGGGRRR